MSERFTALAEWKSVGGTGELVGYMSVFNVLDQGGDVVVPGAFKKTFDGWNRARSPMPLIADHQLDTDGVIGSVVHMAEDGYGASIRAKFSSVPKAQSVRTKMVEGHLNGLSFTYEAIRSHPGTFAGQSARFLDEVRVYEATVTPFPMNQLALASAKAGGGVAGQAADVDQLEALEAWARTAQMEAAMRGMVSNPDSAMHALGVLSQAQDVDRLARLEAWAAAQPPAPSDAERAAARRRADWDRRNRDSNELARVMATMPTCPHPGCMPGRCVYAVRERRTGLGIPTELT